MPMATIARAAGGAARRRQAQHRAHGCVGVVMVARAVMTERSWVRATTVFEGGPVGPEVERWAPGGDEVGSDVGEHRAGALDFHLRGRVAAMRCTPGSERSSRTSSELSVKRTVVVPPRSSTMAPVPVRHDTVEDHDAIAEPLGLLHVVRHEHDGGAGVRIRRTTSQVWRRPTGSRFCVSSSRNTSSGRPTSASATKSRCRSRRRDLRRLNAERVELPLGRQLVERLRCQGGVRRRGAVPRPPACGRGEQRGAGCRTRRRRRSPALCGSRPSTDTVPLSAVAGPGGSRRSWSSRPRSCRAGRSVRHAALRTRRRASAPSVPPYLRTGRGGLFRRVVAGARVRSEPSWSLSMGVAPPRPGGGPRIGPWALRGFLRGRGPTIPWS